MKFISTIDFLFIRAQTSDINIMKWSEVAAEKYYFSPNYEGYSVPHSLKYWSRPKPNQDLNGSQKIQLQNHTFEHFSAFVYTLILLTVIHLEHVHSFNKHNVPFMSHMEQISPQNYR